MCSGFRRSDESADDYLMLLAVPLRQQEWMAADCGWRYQRHHMSYGLLNFWRNCGSDMLVVGMRFVNLPFLMGSVARLMIQTEAVLDEESLG